MRRLLPMVALWACLGAGAAVSERADPLSDAPERVAAAAPFVDAANYADALRVWRGAEDVNAWIGARFGYDMSRAMLLSETQRQQGRGLAITAPADFFAAPRGVCVDLSRFGVETLRTLAPDSRPSYVMIEFSPVSINGNTLRRHWVTQFERDGRLYFFADSKRPGHIAGPYASTAEYIADYAQYRGREIVSHRVLASYEKQKRTLAVRQERTERPEAATK